MFFFISCKIWCFEITSFVNYKVFVHQNIFCGHSLPRKKILSKVTIFTIYFPKCVFQMIYNSMYLEIRIYFVKMHYTIYSTI